MELRHHSLAELLLSQIEEPHDNAHTVEPSLPAHTWLHHLIFVEPGLQSIEEPRTHIFKSETHVEQRLHSITEHWLLIFAETPFQI
jgi:hypothetical protein